MGRGFESRRLHQRGGRSSGVEQMFSAKIVVPAVKQNDSDVEIENKGRPGAECMSGLHCLSRKTDLGSRLSAPSGKCGLKGRVNACGITW